MKQINKKKPPKSFVEHKANKPASYDGLPYQAKDDLRQSLLVEQGCLCCYCMKRIPEFSFPYMKIEHFKSQANYQHLDLVYSNLFGVCTGNEGQPNKIQTCDTKKGNTDFSLDPGSNIPDWDKLFKYTIEGKIVCDDTDIQNEIDELLNLNSQSLQDSRAEVYAFISNLVKAESKRNKNKKIRIKYFESLLLEWLNPDASGKLRPYCMVAVYYLLKKIKQNQG